MKRFRATRVRSTENTPRAGLLIMLVILLLSPAAQAGIADSPLPTLLAGKKTLHLYSVAGGLSQIGLETVFACTSTDTAAQQVGVERFFQSGGSAGNDAVATSVSVGPGHTVTFATEPLNGIPIDSALGGASFTFSARILSTSKKLICIAYIADQINAPPSVMMPLTVVAKVKQKGE